LTVRTKPVDARGDLLHGRKVIANPFRLFTGRINKVRRYGAGCTVTVTFVEVT